MFPNKSLRWRTDIWDGSVSLTIIATTLTLSGTSRSEERTPASLPAANATVRIPPGGRLGAAMCRLNSPSSSTRVPVSELSK